MEGKAKSSRWGWMISALLLVVGIAYGAYALSRDDPMQSHEDGTSQDVGNGVPQVDEAFTTIKTH